MNLYGIPVIGWLVSGVVHLSLAFILWLAWSGVAEFYFVPAGLPEKFVDLGFWFTFQTLVVISILKGYIPTLVSSSSSSSSK